MNYSGKADGVIEASNNFPVSQLKGHTVRFYRRSPYGNNQSDYVGYFDGVEIHRKNGGNANGYSATIKQDTSTISEGGYDLQIIASSYYDNASYGSIEIKLNGRRLYYKAGGFYGGLDSGNITID